MPPAGAVCLHEIPERLVVAPEVVEFLAEGIAEKYPCAILKPGAGQLTLQLIDVVGDGCLDSQFRAQQVARIRPGIERDRPIAGRFSLREPPEAALARRQI